MPHTVILGAGIIGVSTAYYLSHSPSRAQDHTITIIDPNPPASGASGKAGGFIARNWISTATASLEDFSFKLHERLAEQHGGAELWGYRKTQALKVVGGEGKGGPIDPVWRDRHKNIPRKPYSGELNWVKPGLVKSMDVMGEPGNFAQWY
jgi:glycine/D-amino acid oxidase-like deaminating enzyme